MKQQTVVAKDPQSQVTGLVYQQGYAHTLLRARLRQIKNRFCTGGEDAAAGSGSAGGKIFAPGCLIRGDRKISGCVGVAGGCAYQCLVRGQSAGGYGSHIAVVDNFGCSKPLLLISGTLHIVGNGFRQRSSLV